MLSSPVKFEKVILNILREGIVLTNHCQVSDVLVIHS